MNTYSTLLSHEIIILKNVWISVFCFNNDTMFLIQTSVSAVSRPEWIMSPAASYCYFLLPLFSDQSQWAEFVNRHLLWFDLCLSVCPSVSLSVHRETSGESERTIVLLNINSELDFKHPTATLCTSFEFSEIVLNIGSSLVLIRKHRWTNIRGYLHWGRSVAADMVTELAKIRMSEISSSVEVVNFVKQTRLQKQTAGTAEAWLPSLI